MFAAFPTTHANPVFCTIEKTQRTERSFTLDAVREGVHMGTATCQMHEERGAKIGVIAGIVDTSPDGNGFKRGIPCGIGLDLIEASIVALRAAGAAYFVADIPELKGKLEAHGFPNGKDKFSTFDAVRRHLEAAAAGQAASRSNAAAHAPGGELSTRTFGAETRRVREAVAGS